MYKRTKIGRRQSLKGLKHPPSGDLFHKIFTFESDLKAAYGSKTTRIGKINSTLMNIASRRSERYPIMIIQIESI